MQEKSDKYDNVAIDELEDSEIEITGEIPVEYFSSMRTKALKNLGEKTKIDGFRPGHIPEKVLVERLGENVILEEAAEYALSEAYPAIITDYKLSVIGRPLITLTKLAKDNPLGFKIKTAVVPMFTLGEYKKLAKNVYAVSEKIEITDEEVDAVIKDILTTRKQAKQNEDSKKAVGLVDAKGSPLSTTAPAEDAQLPELTDELIKTFGDFKDVDDFKNRITENMKKEKALRAKDKKRAELSELLVTKTDIDVPDILRESELDKMSAQFKEDVARAGATFEDYLAQVKKTEEQLREDWRETAVKRAKLQLILNRIADEQKIVPPENIIEEQVKNVLEHHKDVDERNVRIYMETLLTNELVFGFLEEQGSKESPPPAVGDPSKPSEK